MARNSLGDLIPRLVDKWSFELLHRAKMGETQAMNQVAQIQLSRRGWGRIQPNAVQARRWLEYSAGRGDAVAHQSLQNLRNLLAAREHELSIARQHGLIDYTKTDAHGKIIPPSTQINLPPVSFSRVVSHNPTNILEATTEEELLNSYMKQSFRPLAQTLRMQREKLANEGKPLPKLPPGAEQPIDYHKLEQQQKEGRNQALKGVSEQMQQEIRQRVKTGQISPQDGAKHIKQLQQGEAVMGAKSSARISRNDPSQAGKPTLH